MVDLLLILSGIAAAAAFALSMYRFIAGPRVADRVVAFDVLTIISVTGIVLIALITGREIYLDVALVYALLSFLGVIVAARYLEGGEQ